MDPDDEPDDEGTSGPLLPPDDRLWRHPSEISAGAGRSLTVARGADNRMWTVAVLAGAIGALLAAGVTFAAGGVRTRTVPETAVEKDMVSPLVTVAAVGASAAFVEGAERVRPSVVSITAHDAHGVRTADGVVFRSDGMILTAAHIVVGAQALSATLGGPRRVGARLVATDPASDLAVVKLDGRGYEPAPLGTALDLQVGDPVIDVHPPQIPPSNNDVPGDQGSVGALGAQLTAGTVRFEDLVQVQTSVPPVSVGGPLLDDHGAVVAIMTATGPTGKSMGFALPVDLAREIATQLLASGKVVPVWLGIEGHDLSSSVAKSLGVPGGAVVEKVYGSSPAVLAGLRNGDIVIGLDGRVITSMAVLVMALHARPPGTVVDLDLHRSGGNQTVKAVLAPRPSDTD